MEAGSRKSVLRKLGVCKGPQKNPKQPPKQQGNFFACITRKSKDYALLSDFFSLVCSVHWLHSEAGFVCIFGKVAADSLN